MPKGDFYTLRHEATISTAITFLQAKAGTSYGFCIREFGIGKRADATSEQIAIALVRKSSAATVTTAAIGTHLFKHDPGGPDPNLSLGTAATGVIGSAEGSDSDIICKIPFNLVSGLIYQPLREIEVAVSGIIALKFLEAPTSRTFLAWMVIEEN